MEIPFTIALPIVLSANGRGTVSYVVPTNQEVEFKALIYSSTGVFNLTGIRDSAGLSYTNSSENSPIPSTHLRKAGDNYNHLDLFPTQFKLGGGRTLYIDLIDTANSGNNTVYLSLTAIRTMPNQ